MTTIARPVPPQSSLPFRIEQPGVGWLRISEVPVAGFPRMSLGRSSDTVLVSRLTTISGVHGYLYAGKTPMTGPWRIIDIARSPEALATSAIADKLPQ